MMEDFGWKNDRENEKEERGICKVDFIGYNDYFVQLLYYIVFILWKKLRCIEVN